MKKKMLAVMLSATMVLTTVLTTNVSFAAANTDKFTDLSGHWGQAIINEAATLGVVGGYPEGYYLPDNLMKREEFYKLVTNVLTVVPDTSSTTLAFKDVDPIEWYVPTIKTAVAAGITKGYEDGTFGIGQMISRQEAAKVVATVISTNNLDTTKSASTAKDAALIGDWALPYVNIMFQKGYMQGDNEGNFRPTTALTRAEAATLLLNVKKKETVIEGPNSGNAIVVPPAVTVGDAGCQKTHAVSEGAFTFGTGTRNDPYQISTEAQLNHVREHVSDGAYFQLSQDIVVKSDFVAKAPEAANRQTDWSSGNFAPIGTKSQPFKGVFDGNNYTISGLNITGTIRGDSSSDRVKASYTGLFGCVAESSSVEGLTVSSSKITGNQYTGGIAGLNNGQIDNCIVASSTTVNGSQYTGGIAGYTTKALIGDTNRSSVEGTGSYTGGVVGSAMLKGDVLEDCNNAGQVAGQAKTGGIAGYVESVESSVTIKNCSNTGEVKGSEYNAGGIVGNVYCSEYFVLISNCENSGEISGNGVNGGIAGSMEGRKSKISDCKNEGEISGGSAGGLVGSNEGTVELCYNKGRIVGNILAGGIAGYQENDTGKVLRCSNEGYVTANSNAGGIIGINESKVINCYNKGKVKATKVAGGIAGKNSGTISVVYNAGELEASDGDGALIGRNAGTVEESFWLEDTASSDIGMTDANSVKKLIKKLTDEEMRGDSKIQTNIKTGDFEEILNSYAEDDIWEYSSSYKYPTLVDLQE